MRLNKNKRYVIDNQMVKVINAKYQQQFDDLQAEMIDLFWDDAFGEYENNPDMEILAKYGLTVKPETLSLTFYNPDTGRYDVRAIIRLQAKEGYYSDRKTVVYVDRVIGLEMPENKEWGSVKVDNYDKYRLLQNKFNEEFEVWKLAVKTATTTEKLLNIVPELSELVQTL